MWARGCFVCGESSSSSSVLDWRRRAPCAASRASPRASGGGCDRQRRASEAPRSACTSRPCVCERRDGPCGECGCENALERTVTVRCVSRVRRVCNRQRRPRPRERQSGYTLFVCVVESASGVAFYLEHERARERVCAREACPLCGATAERCGLCRARALCVRDNLHISVLPPSLSTCSSLFLSKNKILKKPYTRIKVHGAGETCGLLSALDVEPKTTRDDPPSPVPADAEPERARLRSPLSQHFLFLQTCQIYFSYRDRAETRVQ